MYVEFFKSYQTSERDRIYTSNYFHEFIGHLYTFWIGLRIQEDISNFVLLNLAESTWIIWVCSLDLIVASSVSLCIILRSQKLIHKYIYCAQNFSASSKSLLDTSMYSHVVLVHHAHNYSIKKSRRRNLFFAPIPDKNDTVQIIFNSWHLLDWFLTNCFAHLPASV